MHQGQDHPSVVVVARGPTNIHTHMIVPVRVPRQVLDGGGGPARVPKLDEAVLPARNEGVGLAPVEVHIPCRAPVRQRGLGRRPRCMDCMDVCVCVCVSKGGSIDGTDAASNPGACTHLNVRRSHCTRPGPCTTAILLGSWGSHAQACAPSVFPPTRADEGSPSASPPLPSSCFKRRRDQVRYGN